MVKAITASSFSLPVQSNSAAAEFDKFSAEIGQARFRMEGGAAGAGWGLSAAPCPCPRRRGFLDSRGEILGLIAPNGAGYICWRTQANSLRYRSHDRTCTTG